MNKGGDKVTVYYAHPIVLYDTQIEEDDIQLLKNLRFNVINPNDIYHQIYYDKYGMDYFINLVKDCDVVAFRSFPDGSIPAGIMKEIEASKYSFELPRNIKGRGLDVEQTRNYLYEMGRR